MIQARYFLQRDGENEREVEKEAWIEAERMAGFWNTMGQQEEPATAAWSANGMRGYIRWERL